MNKVAYLLAYIDTTISPPRVKGVSVFSEQSPTSPLRFRFFEVLRTEGKDYGDALAKMADILGGGNTVFDWVLPILAGRDARPLFGECLPRPPKKLVQLSQVPQSQWVGLQVYHPVAQGGEEVADYWGVL
jgi:hypothetical protein